MEDINSKVIIENLVDYSQICKEQQDTIRRLQKSVTSLQNEKAGMIVEKNKLVDIINNLKNKLEKADKEKQEASLQAINFKNKCKMLSQEAAGYKHEIETLKSLMKDSGNNKGTILNGQKQRVSKEDFIDAYEVTKDLDSLADIFDVQTQTIRNYIKRYIKE